MFLHLGADVIIPLKEVIAIADLKANGSAINREFLNIMADEKMITDISEGNPKCFVITDRMVYFSAISSMTLKKRAEYIREVSE